MAKSFTYVYDIHTDIKNEDFETVLKSSRELLIKNEKGEVTYVYDNKSSIFYPLRFEGDLDTQEMIRFLSIEEIYAMSIKGLHILCFLGHKMSYKGVYLKSLESHIDYVQTITDLEKLERVKTLPTNNYLANDDRMFSFVEDPLVEYEVDCLGTMVCQEISKRVVEEWRRYHSGE